MAHDIFHAIGNGDKAAVQQMVAADPSLAHARNAAGVSALMQARYEGRHEIVQVLRQSTDDLDVFEAATLGDLARLRTLLSTNLELAQAYSSDGFTALHLAAFFNQPEAAETLLAAEANVDAVSRNAMNVAVINSAAASGNAALVKLILRAGADPNARQMAGYTPLHAAAARDDAEMAQALLDAGADPALSNEDGQTASDKAGPAVAALLSFKVR